MDWVDRLKLAVDAKGKQSAVAAAAGVDESALSDILRRKTSDPKVQTLIKVCRVCDVTVGWVLSEVGFELGAADFDLLSEMATWATEKLDERKQRVLTAPSRVVKELPAVATLRGATWDQDELRDRTIPLEYQNAGADAVYVTRGDSMIDAGIFEGDILFVHKSKNWRVANRQIVVCRIEGTFTVKRLRIDGTAIMLHSENGKDDAITINEDEERFELIGIVLGIARDLFRR
jgi:SOS-response transcriptional repressor LexA/DNA-binding Xre family transcriptional regulator